MKKVKQSIALIMLAMVTMISCKKEQGCTDSVATNYSSTAEEDDNSCTYSGQAVFWYDQSIAQTLVDEEYETLYYYFDGQLVGTGSAETYFTSKPSCGQSGSITVNKDLGSSKSKSYSYRVEDDEDNILWEGTKNIDGGSCIEIKLTE